MEIKSTSVPTSGNQLIETNASKAGLTPRELIHYHINNPDKPISDEDIENLVLDTDYSNAVADAPVITYAGAADDPVLDDKAID